MENCNRLSLIDSGLILAYVTVCLSRMTSVFVLGLDLNIFYLFYFIWMIQMIYNIQNTDNIYFYITQLKIKKII